MSVDSLISDALHACADPEHFVRGGSERGPSGQPSAHQRNAIVDNGPPLNADLVAL